MLERNRLVVFNGLMLRGLSLNDRNVFPHEIEAFTVAFRGRRFRILLTDGILEEYRQISNEFPPFAFQPTIDRLFRQNRMVHLEERRLNRVLGPLQGLPSEHISFIDDAIAARAEYLITHRPRWLDLSPVTKQRFGLKIVSPQAFVESEG